MKKKSIIILILWSMVPFCALRAFEQVVIIQAVSADKKSFMVRKGQIDGVVEGQESVFSTDRFSVAARPVEITREHSLWVVSDAKSGVPFQIGQVVHYTNEINNIYSEISALRFDEMFQDVILDSRNKPLENIILRTGLGLTVRETVTDVSAKERTETLRDTI